MEETYEALGKKSTDKAWKQTYSPEKSMFDGQNHKLSRKVAEAMANYETAIEEAEERRVQTTDRTVDYPNTVPPKYKLKAHFQPTKLTIKYYIEYFYVWKKKWDHYYTILQLKHAEIDIQKACLS